MLCAPGLGSCTGCVCLSRTSVDPVFALHPGNASHRPVSTLRTQPTDCHPKITDELVAPATGLPTFIRIDCAIVRNVCSASHLNDGADVVSRTHGACGRRKSPRGDGSMGAPASGERVLSSTGLPDSAGPRGAAGRTSGARPQRPRTFRLIGFKMGLPCLSTPTRCVSMPGMRFRIHLILSRRWRS